MWSLLVQFLLPLLGVIAVLVFVHELGHYLAARAAGVAVERFSVGFGPGLVLGRDRRGTEWHVGVLPLGGYVRMTTDKPGRALGRSFNDAGAGAKAAIAVAGPLANIVFAFVLMLGYFALGTVERAAPVVAQVHPDGPAAAAGLRPGDEVLRLNGDRVESFRDLTRHAALHLDEPMRLDVRRGEGHRALVLRPVVAEVTVTSSGRRERVGLIGARGPRARPERMGLPASARAAIDATSGFAGDTLVGLRQVVTGERSYRSLAGIIGVAQVLGDMVANATWHTVVLFTALISVNVAVINLLPLPILDGGVMVMALLEGWRRRPLPLAVSRAANAVGVVVVLGVLALTTWNDISVLG